MTENSEKQPGFLSAQFNRLARETRTDMGHQRRVEWLTAHFGTLQSTEQRGQIQSVLPYTYLLHYADSRRIPEDHHLRLALERMKAAGENLRDSIHNLYDAIHEHLDYGRKIKLFLPKGTQTPDMIIPGKIYYCVYQDDPSHDHTSEKLLDFIPIEKQPFTGRLVKGDFNPMHTHLIDPKFIP